MKLAQLLTISFMSLTLSAQGFACQSRNGLPSNEAQVIGTVGKVASVPGSANTCSVQFEKFTLFYMNQTCPIYPGEMQGQWVQVEANCQEIVKGQTLSGVVVSDSVGFYLE